MGRALPAQSEAAWQAKVTGLARFYGWRVYHAPDNAPRRARSGRVYVQDVTPGFPDLVLLRPPELIFAELKTEHGRPSVAQLEWLRELERVGDHVAAGNIALGEDRRKGDDPAVEAYLWRPSDLEAVHARLARGRAKTPLVD